MNITRVFDSALVVADPKPMDVQVTVFRDNPDAVLLTVYDGTSLSCVSLTREQAQQIASNLLVAATTLQPVVI